MSTYENFLRVNTPTTYVDNSVETAISKFSKILPSEFISLWESYGFASFHKGLFWLIDPSDWMDMVSEFKPNSDGIVPIFRTSFGDIVYLDASQRVWQLTPILGVNEEIIDNVSDYVNVLLCSDTYYKNAFLYSKHNSAVKKLGMLNKDECYGFEPLLSLDGSEDIANIVKVKAHEYLSLIAQAL